METKWKTNTLIALLLVSVGVLLSMMLTRSCQKPKEIVKETIKTDTLTLVRIDTITQVLPQPYKVVVRDTIYINDTINGNIFVQQIKEYKDSTYYARISGINAYLEEIKVFPKNTTKYIYNTEIVREKPKKWGLGISAGYCFSGDFKPYIGIGVTYNVIQW